MMPKSRRKEKFIFLKQILEESTSDKGSDVKKDVSDSSRKSDGSDHTSSRRKLKEDINAGPVGKYPVFFDKTCKNKGCQTRLSSFPLFPLPGDTEWISDDDEQTWKKVVKDLRIKKKRCRSKNPKNDASAKENALAWHANSPRSAIAKNSDGTRKEFRSEHQLKESGNPVLQAWLHRKNILARKQRKLEKREKRAKRAALEEEARLNDERMIESSEKVGEWFKRKQKEARIARKISKTKVSPEDMETREGIVVKSSSSPPPIYRVVKSFHHTKQSTSKTKVTTINAWVAEESGKVNMQDAVGATASVEKEKVSQPASAVPSKDKIAFDPKHNSKNAGKEDSVEKLPPRPKTASVKHNAYISHSSSKEAIIRPKTTRGPTSKVKSSTGTKKMQSMTYDEWLKAKRNEDKTKVIQKRRDLIDLHLDAVIAELGKKRVEKILSPRKWVETGLRGVASSSKLTATQQVLSPVTKKGMQYQWATSKNPRPEPQGCDCLENQGPRPESSPQLVKIQDCGNFDNTKCVGDAESSTVKSVERRENGESQQDSSTKPKVQICQEVDEKYWELKPSIEKVKEILDSEIKKLKDHEKVREKEQTSSEPDHKAEHLATTKKKGDSTLLRPKSARPKSARPSSARPTSSQHLTDEQAKKLASDLDVLGLCKSDSEHDDNIEEADKMSTVRENYFDYGSDVDPVVSVEDFQN